MATEAISRNGKPKPKKEEVDWELVNAFKEGLDDLKAGRIKRLR